MSIMESRPDNLLNFPLGFTINNVWHRSFIIEAICLSFAIMGEKVNMENGVDLHGWGKSEVIRDRGELLCNRKGAIMMWC